MRIAYLTNSSHLSGVGHRAKNIHDAVSLLAEDKKLVEFNLDGQRGLLSKNGKPIAWTKKWPGLLGNKSINWLRLGKKLEKYIKHKDKNEYDLIHATNQTLSWLTTNLRPMIVTVHDLIELTDPQDKKSAFLNKQLINGVPKADHIIAVSDYTADQIKKVFNIPAEKITVIHNGVGSEFYEINQYSDSVANLTNRRELKIAKEVKIVLFVGSDHPRKNVLGALNIFKIIKEKIPDAILLKVGEPGILKERETLLKQIDSMHLRESVRFAGSVSDAKLNEIYNMSDVLLYPSKNEGFGLPLIQAMKCGLPIVSSNATAIPEVVGDSGIVLDVNDTKGMADNCLDIFHNETKRQSLKIKGLARAKLFTWEKAATQVISVYNKIVNNA